MMLAGQVLDGAGPGQVEMASTQLLDIAATESAELQSELASELRIDAIVDSLFEEEQELLNQEQVGQDNSAHRNFIQAQQQADVVVDKTLLSARNSGEDAADSGSIRATPQAPRGPPVGEEYSAGTTRTDDVLVVLAHDVDHPGTIKEAFGRQAVRYLDLELGVDPISQITQQLEQMGTVNSLHLFTHGSPAAIHLGELKLNASTLEARSAEIASWSNSLAANAQVLIYSCDVAQGEDGQNLIDHLAELTHVTVAASTDATGSPKWGGDWELEYQAGPLADAAGISLSAYPGLLGTIYSWQLADAIPNKTVQIDPDNLLRQGVYHVTLEEKTFGDGGTYLVLTDDGTGNLVYEESPFLKPTGSLTIEGLDGDDTLTLGSLALGATSFSAEAQTIIVSDGAEISSTSDITLLASKTGIKDLESLSPIYFQSKDTAIIVGAGARIAAANLTIRAESRDISFSSTLDTSSGFNNFVIDPLINGVSGLFNLPFKLMFKESNAAVTIQENVVIDASGGVTIETDAVSDVSRGGISTNATGTRFPVEAESGFFSVGYVETIASATTKIESGVTIEADGAVGIAANGSAASLLETKTTGDTLSMPLAFSLAITRTDLTVHATVADDVTITAGQVANVTATGSENSEATAGSELSDQGKAGLALGLSFADADVKADVRGDIRADVGAGSVVKFEFDPTVSGVSEIGYVDAAKDTIRVGSHALSTGDGVNYTNRRGDSIGSDVTFFGTGGLTDDTDYFVITTDVPEEIQLAETRDKAIEGTAIDLGVGAAVNSKEFTKNEVGDNSITLANQASAGSLVGSTFEIGQAVRYDAAEGSQPIGGLTDGANYYVIASTNQHNLSGDSRFVDEQVIQLAESENEAHAGIGLNLDTTGISGTHVLTALQVLDSGLTTGIGIVASLEGTNVASGESGSHDATNDDDDEDDIPGLSAIFDGLMGKLLSRYSSSHDRSGTGSNSSFELGGGVAVVKATHTVESNAGSSANLQSNEDLEVKAEHTQELQVFSKGTVDNDEADYAIVSAVSVSLVDNTAKATVETGAKLDALRATRVISDITYPYLTRPDEFIPMSQGELVDQLEADGKDGVKDYFDGTLGLQSKMINTWSQASGQAGEFAVAGSVNYVQLTNISEAIVESGVEINQDVSFRDSAQNSHGNNNTQQQVVSIEATSYLQFLNVTGTFDFSFLEAGDIEKCMLENNCNDLVSAGLADGMGGAIFIALLDNTTNALVESTAKIYSGGSGGFNMKAEEAIMNFVLTQAGASASGSIGIAGTVGYFEQDSRTKAQLAGGAIVTGGSQANEADVAGSPVTIYAGSLETHINWAGAVASGENAGFGITVALNDIDRETEAIIGDIDPSVDAANGATNPSVDTRVETSGDIKVNASAVGDLWAFSLAAAMAGVETPEAPDPTESPESVDGVKPKYGIGVSANVSLNSVLDDVNAYIYDAGHIEGASLDVSGLNSSVLNAFAIAASVTVPNPSNPAKTQASIAGSFSQNTLTGNTRANVAGENVAVSKKLVLEVDSSGNISADRKGSMIAITAGLGVTVDRGTGVSLTAAGSVSVNEINNTTQALMSGVQDDTNLASPDSSAPEYDLAVRAKDTSTIFGLGGAVSIGLGGSSAAVGFSLVTNTINNQTNAEFQDLELLHVKDVTADAANVADIDAITLSGSLAAGSGFQVAVSGSVSINTIDADSRAAVTSGSEISAAGDVSITAADEAYVSADGGGVAIGLSTGTSSAGSMGISVGINTVTNDTEALIEDSNLTATGAISVSSKTEGTTDEPTIDSLVLAGAGGGSIGNGASFVPSAAGAYALNEVSNTIEAVVINTTEGTYTITADTGDISVSAIDKSSINADVVGAAVSFSGGTGSSGSMTIGVSIGINEIDNSVNASVDKYDVNATLGKIAVNVTETATISALAVAASLSGSSGSSSSLSLSGGGSDVSNVILTKSDALVKQSLLNAPSNDIDVTAVSTSSIEAIVATVSASVTVSGSSSGGASIGASRARNFIGVTVDGVESRARSDASIRNSKIEPGGDLNLTSSSNQDIDADVWAASVAISGGSNSVGLAGSGVETINEIYMDVGAYIDGDAGANGIQRDAMVISATDNSAIAASGGAASLAVAAGGTSVSLSIGVALAANTIDSDVEAYITNVSSNIETQVGSVSVQADNTMSIDATTTAASVAASLGTTGVAISGAGAEATNVILGSTLAYIDNSHVISADGVGVSSTNSASIDATIVSAAVSVAVGSTGVGAAIGVGLARNFIGWQLGGGDSYDYTFSSEPTQLVSGDLVFIENGARAGDIYRYVGNTISESSEDDIVLSQQDYGDSTQWELSNLVETGMPVHAFLKDTSMDAEGSLAIIATANQTVDAIVVAASGAISAGSVGVGLSGAGVSADNRIASDVQAYIDGDGSSGLGIDALHVSISAEDTSIIDAEAEAASLAAAFAGSVGVSLSIGVSIATNTITNDVQAYLVNAASVTAISVDVSSEEQATVDASSVAASLSVAVGSLGVALSGAGADSTNVIANEVEAYIQDSSVTTTTGDVNVVAESSSTITALVGAVAAAVSGGAVAVSGAVGVSLGRNRIGYKKEDGSGLHNSVLAYIKSAVVNSGRNILVEAHAVDRTSLESFSGSVALAAGMGAAVAGSGAEATTQLGTKVEAYILNSTLVAGADITVDADADSVIQKSHAIGTAVAASVVGVAAAASIVDNSIQNQVVAYINSNQTAHNVEAAGAIAIKANQSKARIVDSQAVTASVAAGAYAVSGGGVDIDHTINNTISAYVVGPSSKPAKMLDATGSVSIEANEDAFLSADATNVTIAYGLGAAIGVSLLDVYITSTITAYADNTRIEAASVTVAAESVANISENKSAGVSASLVGAVGNHAKSHLETTVDAYIDNSFILATDAVTVTATGINTARADANGGAFGAIAVGAMIAEVNLGKSDVDYEVQAGIGESSEISANALYIVAESTDDLLTSSVAAGGGVYSGTGSESDLTTNLGTLARIGNSSTINVGTLSVTSDHQQDLDSSADSYSLALASGSGAGAQNDVTTKADIDIGTDVTINAENIFVFARNKLDKDEYKDSSNLRSGSAALLNVTVLQSETQIGTSSSPFTSKVEIGTGTQMSVTGTASSPGIFKIEALNDITAYDVVRVETVSGFGVSAGISRITTNSEASIDIDGATLTNNMGDIYLTTKTDTAARPSINMFSAGAYSGSGGEANADVNPNNTVNLENATVQARDIYVYAGRNSYAVGNQFEANVNMEMTTAALYGITVPVPKVNLDETNTVNVTGTSQINGLQNVNFVAAKGPGGEYRAQADGLALNIAIPPYPLDIGSIVERSDSSTNSVNIQDTATVTAGINNQSLVHLLPLTIVAADGSGAKTVASVQRDDQTILIKDLIGEQLNASEKIALGLPTEIEYEYAYLQPADSMANSSDVDEKTLAEALTDKFYVIKPVALELPEISYRSLTNLLVTQRDTILGWMTSHAGDTEALARYSVQLEEINEAIDDLGLTTVEADYDTDDGSKRLLSGNRVHVTDSYNIGGTQDYVYEYTGSEATIDLSATNYSNTAVWTGIGTSGELTTVSNSVDLVLVSMPNILAAPGSIFIDVDGISDEAITGDCECSYKDNSYLDLKNTGRLNARAGAGVEILNQTPFMLEVNEVLIADSKKIVITDGQYNVLTPGNLYVNNALVGSDSSDSSDDKTITITQDAFLQAAYDISEVELPDIDQDMYIVGDVTNENGAITIDNREGSISSSGAILGETVTILSAKDFSLNVDDWYHTNRDPRQYVDYDTYREIVFEAGSGTFSDYALSSDVTGLDSAIAEDESKILALGEISITARYLNVNGLIQSGTDEVDITIDDSFVGSEQTLSFRDASGDLQFDGISFGGEGIPVDGYFDASIDQIVIEDIAPSGGEITIAGQILSTGNGRLKVAYGYTDVTVTNQSEYDLIINKIDVSSKRDGTITIIESNTLKKTVYTTDGTNITEEVYSGAAPTGSEVSIQYTLDSTFTHSLEVLEYDIPADLLYVWTEGQEKTTVTTTKFEKNSFNLLGFDWDALAADEEYDWKDTEYRDQRPLLESESLITATADNYGNSHGQAYTIKYVEKTDDDVDVIKDLTLVKDGSTVYRYVGPTGEVNFSLANYQDATFWEATTINADTFTEDVDNNQFESSYQSFTETTETWTTGGGWLRKKTYHTKITTIQGYTDFYTHTLKADYPIEIEFLAGSTAPNIVIDTAHNLRLLNNIVVPEAGTVTGADSTLLLRARGSELTAAEGTAIYGVTPQFFVGEDPDDHAEITFTGGMGQELHVEAGGDIQVNVVSEDNTSSSVIVDQVLSKYGNVTIVAPHGITAYDADSLIEGNLVQLDVVSGSVGTLARPIAVNSSYREDAGIAIRAKGDIYLTETTDNMLLAEPTAWSDPVASIYTESGDIYLATTAGSIIDNWIEAPQTLTDEEVAQLDSNLQLSGTDAEAAALTAIRAEENQATTLYHNYWIDERELTRASSSSDVIAIASIDFDANQVTTSSSHGLSTGDQVYFQPADDLEDAQNLVADINYYAIVTDGTHLELAASRYDAVISASPVAVEITQYSEIISWDGFEIQEFGYTTNAYESSASVDTGYQDTHDAYGSQDYDSNFIFEVSAEEEAERVAARTFDTETLKNPMSQALVDYLYPNVDTIDLGGSATSAENTNIYANNLEIVATAANGGRVGDVSEITTIDFAAGFEAISEAEKGLLGMAVAEDVIGYTYFLYEYLGAAATIDLTSADYSDTALWNSVTVDLFTETRFAEQVELGAVALKNGQVLLVQFASEIYGRYQYVGADAELDLAETDFSETENWKELSADHDMDGGSSALTTGNLVQDRDSLETLTIQLWEDVDTVVAGEISINVDGAVAFEVDGTMTLEQLVAEGDIRLAASDGIMDANTGVTDALISGDNLNLTVSGGSVGTSSQPILVALTNAARVSASVSDSIYLAETINSLSVGTVVATNSAVLISPYSIIDALNSSSNNVVAAVIQLEAEVSIGSDTQSLGVRSTSTAGVDIQSGKHVYLSTEQADMLIGTISAANDVVLRSTAGVIDAADTDAANITGDSLSIVETQSVGSSDNWFDVELSDAGAIRFEVTGDVYATSPLDLTLSLSDVGGSLYVTSEQSLVVSNHINAVDRIDLDGSPVVFSSVSGAFTSGDSSVIDIRSGSGQDLDILGTVVAGGAGGTSGIVWSGNDASVYLGADQQVYLDGAVFASDLVEVVGGTPGDDDDDLSILVSTRAGVSSGGQTSDGTPGQVTVQSSGDLEIMGHLVGGGTLVQTFDDEGEP